MSKYISDENYQYENYDFYYKVNNDYYFEKWQRPTKEKLLNLLNYFNTNYSKSNLFKIYLTGKFNSNMSNNTWNVDIIITYNDISNKNYSDIYDCMYFLNHYSLNQLFLLLNIKYLDTINNINEIINTNTINDDENIIKQNIYNYIKNQGEILTFYEIIVKYNNTNNDKFNQTINLNYHTALNSENNKKLFLFNINEDNLDNFKSIYLEKVNNITNGTIYNDNILINNCGITEETYFN
jgi:hypothetical protein